LPSIEIYATKLLSTVPPRYAKRDTT